MPTVLLHQNSVYISGYLFRLSSTFTFELYCSVKLYQGYNSLLLCFGGIHQTWLPSFFYFLLTFSFFFMYHVKNPGREIKSFRSVLLLRFKMSSSSKSIFQRLVWLGDNEITLSSLEIEVDSLKNIQIFITSIKTIPVGGHF